MTDGYGVDVYDKYIGLLETDNVCKLEDGIRCNIHTMDHKIIRPNSSKSQILVEFLNPIRLKF